MKTIIITGSNGMIGSLILQYCLQREDVSRITSITRKPTGIHHPKLTEVFHDDFLDYTNIEQHFTNQDICFFCIGVYTGQVPKDAFKKVTIDFTKAFAECLKRKSPNVSFCFLSGQGADSSEKSLVLFAKSKGIAENILINLHFAHLAIFRPGYIYPVTPRIEPNKSYKVFRALWKPVLSKLFPFMGLTSEQLAKAMVNIGFNGGNKIIYENNEIKKISD
jgi:nucleoside-diphosphate-sugar epimerase